MNERMPQRTFWSRHARDIIGVGLLALAIHDVFGAHGFLAMRRTQKEMEQLRGDIARLNQEMVRFLNTKEAKEQLLKTGTEAAPSTPDQFSAFIKSEMLRMGKVIKDAGISAD